MPGSHSKKDKLKKKVAKVRKADQQDINRVKRWNSRSFNKKKELSGPTEPVFKTTEATNSLTTNLRNRLAKVSKQLTAGDHRRTYRENNPRKKSEIYKSMGRNIPPTIRKNAPLKKEVPFPKKKKLETETYGNVKIPANKGRTGNIDRAILRTEESKLESYAGSGKKIRPRKPSQKQRSQIIKARLAKIENYNAEADPEASAGEWINKYRKKRKNKIAKVRKADGGVAPNYNNPSKIRKKKSATKAAATSKTGYLGDASVNIPWGEEEVNITLRDMAQFHRKNMWVNKQGTFPQIWNLGSLTGEGQGARQIFDAAHDVENRFVEDMGLENYQKNMQSEIDHLIKEYGEDPEGDLSFNEELTRTQDNLGLGEDVPQSRRNEIKRRQKKERGAKQKAAARSAVNKGVNKVNPIKPTKKYKTKPPQGPLGDTEKPDEILFNAEVAGRKNDTYIGKTIKEGGYTLKERRNLKKKNPKPKNTKPYKLTLTDQLRSISGYKDRPKKPTQQDRIDVLEARKRIARIRKANIAGYRKNEKNKFSEKGKFSNADAHIKNLYKKTTGSYKIPPTSSGHPKSPLKKEVPFGKKIQSFRQRDYDRQYSKALDKYVTKGKKIRPKINKKMDRTEIMKAKISKIRKATEQVDPRVKKRKTVRPNSPVQKVSQMKDRIAEMKIAKDHSHSIAFRKHEGQYYRRASLTKQEGKYAKYWLLNAKQMNGNGWGVSPTSIAKNINKFIGRPFVVTAKQWVAESEYGDQFEHPYLPTNNIDNILHHQEKFRVGSIVDVVEKDGDYHAVIEMNSKFANMMLPPFCSPAIFQNNPGEADGEISDWEALHLAGLMEDPAYGARIALLKGSCMGTAEACSIQFKGAKLTKTMCPKKKAKLVRRLDRLGD